jgi:hypothetical protein
VNAVLDALARVAVPVSLRSSVINGPGRRDGSDGAFRPVEAWKQVQKHETKQGSFAFAGIAVDEARRVSESEGVALNQFMNVAVAEKLSRYGRKTIFASEAAEAM